MSDLPHTQRASDMQMSQTEQFPSGGWVAENGFMLGR